MTRRITVAAKVEDARALGYLRTHRDIFPGSKIRSVAVAQAYTVDAKLTAKEIDTFAKRLTNPLIEEYSTSRVIAPKKYTFVIEIGFHPGVTDNVAKTARQMLEDALGKKLKKDEDVYTSFFVFIDGVSRSDAEAMAR
ncbi:MAG: hypothetical protein ACYCZ0_04145, partial [Minisyncoccota bacterium]